MLSFIGIRPHQLAYVLPNIVCALGAELCDCSRDHSNPSLSGLLQSEFVNHWPGPLLKGLFHFLLLSEIFSESGTFTSLCFNVKVFFQIFPFDPQKSSNI